MEQQPEPPPLSDDDLPPATAEGPWRPQTIVDLDFCLERLGQLRRLHLENLQVRDAQVERAGLRAAELNAPLEKRAAWWEGLVRQYAEEMKGVLLVGKARSRQLDHGTVAWRKSSGGLKVVDETALLAWAKQQPVENDFLRLGEERLALKAIKAHWEKTGEVPPGTDVAPEQDILKVEV